MRSIRRKLVRVAVALYPWYGFFSIGQLHAQNSDPFIGTIEKVNRAIGAVICPHDASDRRIELGTGHGTAFFTDAHGMFLTAAHVIKGVLEAGESQHCDTPALLVGANKAVRKLSVYALRFTASDCKLDETADLARCNTNDDLETVDKIESKPAILSIMSDLQSEGTPVAFSGFPLNALIPYTARANIAGYQIGKPESQQEPEVSTIVLDRSAWPGASGAPVYLHDGSVIGLMLQRGTAEATGLSFARPGARIKEFLHAP